MIRDDRLTSCTGHPATSTAHEQIHSCSRPSTPISESHDAREQGGESSHYCAKELDYPNAATAKMRTGEGSSTRDKVRGEARSTNTVSTRPCCVGVQRRRQLGGQWTLVPEMSAEAAFPTPPSYYKRYATWTQESDDVALQPPPPLPLDEPLMVFGALAFPPPNARVSPH